MGLKETLTQLREKIEEITSKIEELEDSEEIEALTPYFDIAKPINQRLDSIGHELLDLREKLKNDSSWQDIICTAQTEILNRINNVDDRLIRLFEKKESKSPEDQLNREIARVLFQTSQTMYDVCIKVANQHLKATGTRTLDETAKKRWKKTKDCMDCQYWQTKNGIWGCDQSVCPFIEEIDDIESPLGKNSEDSK